MEELVILKNDQALTDSLTVAEMFGKRHDHVLRAIDNLAETLPKSGERKLFIPSRRKADDGQFHRFYLMNRDGFSLLVMGFNGKKAMEWKLKYIEAFNKMEALLQETRTTPWISTRNRSKLIRKEETDVIKKLVEYAEEQGSTHADMLYRVYSRLANTAAGITNRDESDVEELCLLIQCENMIRRIIERDMRDGLAYKAIYQDCKARLNEFLHIGFLDVKESEVSICQS